MPQVLSVYFQNHKDSDTFCHTITQTPATNALIYSFPIMLLTNDSNVNEPCSYVIDEYMCMAMFLMGLGFIVLYLVVAFNVKLVGQRLLFCKYIHS